jgi:glucosamine-phosphate N-acetyltransferase
LDSDASVLEERAICVRRASDLDRDKGLLEILGQLSPLGEAGPLYRLWRAYKVVFVAEVEGRIVGTVSILVERKLTHDNGRVAHVEDVVVDESQRGTDVGSRLLRTAVDYARAEGCYKVVLSCHESVARFYERNGFRRHEVTMRLDLDETEPEVGRRPR